MAKQFDWDEFLQSVTNGTPEYYKSRLTEFVRYDLQNNDIVAPDTGCYVATLNEPIRVDEAILLREVTDDRVIALYTMFDDHPGSVMGPITRALAIFPIDDVSKATLTLKGCPFVDLTS
ncbi:hypothetical protein [Agrobacterium tumefaciens]|uniref:Uncharacterized protein n=1 Tax=Agrobacterium tumefaciens TaxID=358 RepID=A0AA44F6M4_AGRTU|nr:hypothetical protein [Agrobacterium tumefaciens]NTB86844.1 hypothetical protein [Agrobacterium tumefaciens]NTC21173.1 hypothetical protein [Agrobacterium tumefaciens]NTC30721.1 hypothetical protein [Agrobacterium tumefaciens]